MFDGMTMCFHAAKCPIHLAGGANKSTPLSKSWISTPLAFSARQSSVVLHTEGAENPSEPSRDSDLGSSLMGSVYSSPVLSHTNTVGVIGGASAISTVTFLDKLVKWSLRHEGESLPFITCSDPVLSRELVSTRERNSIPYARSRKTQSQLDHGLIADNLRQKRVFLEQSGARCIVMPCYISHAWYDRISHGSSIPFLHVGECVAKELKEAKLKPVETGSNVRIGILAPDPILMTGFYQEKLQNEGFEVVLPDEATMEHAVIPAMEALNRKDIEGARNLLRIALQVLLVRAVNTIILASDDMLGILPPNDPLLKKCIDPMDALVRSTVQWAHSKVP